MKGGAIPCKQSDGEPSHQAALAFWVWWSPGLAAQSSPHFPAGGQDQMTLNLRQLAAPQEMLMITKPTRMRCSERYTVTQILSQQA